MAVVKLGIEPLQAWEYTPAEIGLICEQVIEKRNYEVDCLLSLAWHIEAFSRQKRLPQLQGILKNKSGKTVNKSDEILKAMAKEKGVIIK